MKKENTAESQASSQYSSIISMLTAVECDYERLDELKEEREGLEGEDLAQWEIENGEELATLKNEAGDCDDQDEARQRIQEDPLSVEVRSGWTSVGEELKPSEFMILLCTGGPACRIVGELSDHGEPCRAWMEYQDWGTSWTQYFPAKSDNLVSYALNFFFGE